MTKGGAGFPAVVLLHGSGPSDRDGTIGPNRPLRDLAWGLASMGIAALRYDKRTFVHGARMDPVSLTVEEEALLDADSALALLGARSEIDPHRLFVAGHSLGGALAPLVAARYPELAGIAILSAPARPIPKVMANQVTYLLSLKPDASRAARLEKLLAETNAVQSQSLPDTTLIMGISVRYLRDLELRDPAGTAARLTLPILVMHGGRDYQASEVEFDLWQQKLAGNPAAVFRLYPELNHIFHPGQGVMRPEEYELPGHVDARVIHDLGEWILRP